MRTSPLRVQTSGGLLDVLVDELGHLEHRDLALATEDRLELVVGVDHTTLLRILKPIALDVRPELLRDLGARKWVVSDDCTERRIRLLRRHEGGVGFALRAALLGGLLRATLLGSALLRAALLRAALLGGLLRTLLCSHSLSR